MTQVICIYQADFQNKNVILYFNITVDQVILNKLSNYAKKLWKIKNKHQFRKDFILTIETEWKEQRRIEKITKIYFTWVTD